MPREELSICVDKERISEVFINLINNALKFTESGYIMISITDKEHFIACSVFDTGIGISENDLSNVFNRFLQFDRIRDNREKGFGLGLSICKNIVSLHGGKIWAESKPGQGTRFTFTLPK